MKRHCIILIFLIPILFVILTGCSGLPTSQIYMERDWKKHKRDYTCLPGIVMVQSDIYSKEIRDNAEACLALL